MKQKQIFFLEFSCFFSDPMDVSNLISGFSAFSKMSLNIWEFLLHILLKSSLENLSITLLAGEMSAVVKMVNFMLCVFHHN